MGTILIKGDWVDAVDGETIDVMNNPSTGEVLSKLSRGKAEDIDRAVQGRTAREKANGAGMARCRRPESGSSTI